MPKKSASCLLADSLDRCGFPRKAERCRECGGYLVFAHSFDLATGEVGEKGKLSTANFCRERLCPMCAWRKTQKLVAQMLKVVPLVAERYEFLLLTLTVPSVSGDDLSATFDRILSGWRRLAHRKRFTGAVRGWMRSVEVTRNNSRRSKSFGLWHPHIHALLAVPRSYFSGRKYINRADWLQMWRECYGDDTITQVDVRRVRADDEKGVAGAVLEVCKYMVKTSDFIHPDDPDLTDACVSVLSSAFYNRRFVAFSGVFAKARRKLALDDWESGDLVHLNDTAADAVRLMCAYGWRGKKYDFLRSWIEWGVEGERAVDPAADSAACPPSAAGAALPAVRSDCGFASGVIRSADASASGGVADGGAAGGGAADGGVADGGAAACGAADGGVADGGAAACGGASACGGAAACGAADGGALSAAHSSQEQAATQYAPALVSGCAPVWRASSSRPARCDFGS